MKERVFVSDLRAGDQLDQVFALRERTLRERRDGVPFLRLRLADKTGELDGMVWEQALAVYSRIVDAEFVRVDARVERYQAKNQLNITSIDSVPAEKVNVRHFLPETPRSRKELWRQLEELRKSVRDPHLSGLLGAFFEDETLAAAFRDAPAARGFHHAYLGGLLEHTVSVAALAAGVAEHYPDLDRELLIAGALLHDVGKTRELSFKTTIDYSDEGRLLGHIVIGDSMVAGKIARLPDFPQELAKKLRHLLLSHHGELEYGSPVEIKIPEAFALHFLDNLDAKLNMVKRLAGRAGVSEARWTSYDPRVGRQFFLGERESGPPKP